MTKTLSWQECKLDDLGFVGRGKSKHRPRNDPSLYGGDYPFVQTGDIKNATLHLTDYSQTYNEKGFSQSKLWEPETLCITIAANIADTAILGKKACFPDSIVGFIADPQKADVRFVKYYIDTIKLQMQNVSKGTTQDNLSLDKLLRFNFRVPPLILQHKIAYVISAYDYLIENSNRRIKILEGMAQIIYNEWFVKFRFPEHSKVKMVKSELGEIPEGWEVILVRDAIERISAGKRYDNKSALPKGKVPILDQGKSGVIGYHNNEPDVMASEGKPLIVFANHTCYQTLVMFPFSSIQNVLPFIASSDKQRDIYWLHYATKDVVKFNDYKGHYPEFISKKVILPLEDICSNFGHIVKSLLQLKYRLEQKNVILQQTRDLLLPRLISGELDVENLNIKVDN